MPLSSFDGPQIRLVLNEDTYPSLSCAKTTQDHKYGACSLEAFVKANEFSTSISFGDDTWEAVCGHPHSEGMYVQEEFLGNFAAQTPKHAHGVCLLYSSPQNALHVSLTLVLGRAAVQRVSKMAYFLCRMREL